MNKIAYVIGADGANIEFARSDGEKIKKSLTDLGFSFIKDIPDKNKSVDEVMQGLDASINACKKGDMFVMYYAGHGIKKGTKLYLTLENSTIGDIGYDLMTTLDAARLVDRVEDFCKARHKLIILDACHSGLILKETDFGKGFKSNYHIMTAADIVDKAVEIPAYKGGFLSHQIALALSGTEERAYNNWGKITPYSLTDWIRNARSEFMETQAEHLHPPAMVLGGVQRVEGFWLASKEEAETGEQQAAINKAALQVERLSIQQEIVRQLSQGATADFKARRWNRKKESLSKQINFLEEELEAIEQERNLAMDAERKLQFTRRIDDKEQKIDKLIQEIEELERTIPI